MSKIYSFLLKIKLWSMGVDFGSNITAVNSFPYFRVSGRKSKVQIGNNFVLNNHANAGWYSISRIEVDENASLTIGNNTGISGTLIYCSNSITIGNNVKIGGGTRIFDTNFHTLDYEKRRIPVVNRQATTAPIRIEDDVFIGTGCIICKGVTIGARSIVAAGSVVVKDIPADCIAGGNPCTFIKSLNI